MTAVAVRAVAEPLDEAELIERARRGDVEAYGELLGRYLTLGQRAAWVILGDEAEAEDATQSAAVRAWSAMNRFRSGSAFRPWFLTVVANEARNRKRAAGRRRGLQLKLSNHLSTNVEESAEHSILQLERNTELVRAINRLREEDREVIACRYFLDLSEAETALVLACRRGTVKSRLSRALARLRLVLSCRDDPSQRGERDA